MTEDDWRGPMLNGEKSAKRYEPEMIDIENPNVCYALELKLVGRNKTVLEVGPATGYITRILKSFGNRVCCVEIDNEAAKEAEKYCDMMIVGDIEELDLDSYFEAEQFDVILFGDVLEHLRWPKKVLKKVKKYLKPDGYIVASIPNIAHGDIILSLICGKFEYRPLGLLDETHLRFFTIKNIFKMFRESGYKISEVYTTKCEVGYSEFGDVVKKVPLPIVNFVRKLPYSNVYQFVVKAYHAEYPVEEAEIEEISISDIPIDEIVQLQRKVLEYEKELRNLKISVEVKEERIKELRERLEAELRRRDERISELENSLSSKVDEIKSLNQEIERIKSDLNAKLKEAREENARLRKEISSKEEQIRKLTEDVMRLSSELESVKSSVTWKAVMKWHSFVERVAPLGTRRRKWYDLGIRGLRILVSFGLRHFLAEYRHFRRTKSTRGEFGQSHYFEKVLAGKVGWKLKEEVKQKLSKTVVILPVYNQPEILENCLKSLVKNTPGEVEILAIDDSSPDPRVQDVLEKYSSRIKTIRNDRNMGFVRTVNRGFELSRDKEIIVVLNQDTEVPPLWVERLITPIVEDPKVASVTPMSNAATIMSFPEFCKDNERFLGLSVELIDNFFMKYGNPEPIEVPTAVGFCMAINRKVLDEVGYFDAETFGRGYGEENDWCMRARKKGYKNVGITYLYVFHNHGSCFGPEKEKLLKENLGKLRLKHPEYFAIVDDFVKRDPLKEVRDTVKLLIGVRSVSKRNVLVITNNLGGGSEVYLNNLKRALSNTLNFVDLRYDFRNSCWLLNDTIKLTRNIEENGIFNKLVEILNIDVIFVNEVVSHPNPLHILQLMRNSGKPYIFAFHDYFAICPNWNLVSPSGWFCGLNNDHEFCQLCLNSNSFSDFKIFYNEVFDLKVWRESWREFLENAKSVVFFSESSRSIVDKVYKLENGVLIEHYVEPLPEVKVRDDGILTVGILGSIGFSKGWGVVKKLVDKFKNYPVRFVVIGVTAEIHKKYEKGNLTVTGKFRREELPEIVEEYNVDVILIPSVWPETYSYTTTEAIMMGLPVIVFNMGAQAERVRKFDAGFVVNDYAELRELIMEMADNKIMPERRKSFDGKTLEEWSEEYKALFEKAFGA